MANRITTFVDGNALTAAQLNSEVDNIYIGTIDRSAGRWGSLDDITVAFGSSQDVSIEWDTTQTQDCMIITTDGTSNTIIICEEADKGTNFGIAAQTNPTLVLKSATAASTTKYLALSHNDTNGVVNAASGGVAIQSAGTQNILASGGKIFIGTHTTDANVTTGLSINQGAADDRIITMKSSDIAHGITTFAETDTYGYFGKMSANNGGLQLIGLAEVTGAIDVQGVHTTDDSTRSTAATAVVFLTAGLKSGTTSTVCGAGTNMVVIRNQGTARFIFDADGTSYEDVGTAWTNYDDHDDTALLTALSVEVSREGDPIKEQFGRFLKYNRGALERAGIVTFNEDGHHFLNTSKFAMLLCGAIRQLGAKVESLEARLLTEGA